MCIEMLINQFIGEIHQYCLLKNKVLFQVNHYYSKKMDCYFVVHDYEGLSEDKQLLNYVLKLMNGCFFSKGIVNVCFYYEAEYMNEVKLKQDFQRGSGRGLILEGYYMDDLTVQFNMNLEGIQIFNVERSITVFYDEARASIDLRFDIQENGLMMKGNFVGHFVYDGLLLLEQVDEMLSVNAVMLLGQKLDEMIKGILLSLNFPKDMFSEWDIVENLIQNDV